MQPAGQGRAMSIHDEAPHAQTAAFGEALHRRERSRQVSLNAARLKVYASIYATLAGRAPPVGLFRRRHCTDASNGIRTTARKPRLMRGAHDAWMPYRCS